MMRWKFKKNHDSCWESVHLMGAESLNEHQNTHGVAGQQQTPHLGRGEIQVVQVIQVGCITNWNHWLNSGNGWKWIIYWKYMENAPWLKRSQVFHSYFKRCFSDRRAATYPSEQDVSVLTGQNADSWWNHPFVLMKWSNLRCLSVNPSVSMPPEPSYAFIYIHSQSYTFIYIYI